MEKYCTQCGAPLEEDARFCTQCSAPVDAEPETNEAPESSNTMSYSYQYAEPNQAPQAPVDEKPERGSKYAPISALGFIGILLLFQIPIIGLIFMIIWAFGGCRKVNKRSLSRAMLTFTVISIVCMVATFFAIRTAWINLTENTPLGEFLETGEIDQEVLFDFISEYVDLGEFEGLKDLMENPEIFEDLGQFSELLEGSEGLGQLMDQLGSAEDFDKLSDLLNQAGGLDELADLVEGKTAN